MDRRAAFVLNLDADLELATKAYTPSEAVVRASREHAARLATTLLRDGDVLVDDGTPAESCAGLIGRAFSPTPRALAQLRRVGAIVPDVPDLEVLRRVSRRDFGYRAELRDSFVSADADEILERTARALARGEEVRWKRVHGMAGRGHRVVRERTSPQDEAFARATPEGLIVEPNVAITRELAMHGMLARDGTITRGVLVASRVDALGRWVASTPVGAGELPEGVADAVRDALDEAGVELGFSGYFGPFGIDAFLHRDRDRDLLRSRSEIHARYSMGWAIGMRAAGTRPDL